jgi:hypothetical protein
VVENSVEDYRNASTMEPSDQIHEVTIIPQPAVNVQVVDSVIAVAGSFKKRADVHRIDPKVDQAGNVATDFA